MEESSNTYYANLTTKLVRQKPNPKTYWSVIKRFFKHKITPYISSLSDENKFVTDFRKKVEFFNSFFPK